uniref:src kinase-associated phosphoprotein 1 isoform X1 n=1 Tax=Monopterus albus TaxID=43700 RepID=UPI0009B34101|nr:src kinase-associated phosphoprotein 1 isoform X1 [Monopterus albus]XP_020460381.1 src kinase-associated phosphoprotein 1 isoform X1 [Monopterus albus]XP_020460383.1 src kinase-associated phosphoprotein 1 isoform X1 [Monopterus albus]
MTCVEAGGRALGARIVRHTIYHVFFSLSVAEEELCSLQRSVSRTATNPPQCPVHGDAVLVTRWDRKGKNCELFVFEHLQDENLSESVQEIRKILLNNFRIVHARMPEEFPFQWDYRDEDGSDDNRSLGHSAPSDDASLLSDYQDDGPLEYFEDIPPVAAQDLSNILKQGYLEKKRRDHSFFGSEWQKRWCVLNNEIFYYYGSEKDKQQKGSLNINGYSVQLVTNLRKDSKKNACFEFFAPGLRTFQFTASSPQEAREWVDQINFVLKDLSSSSIPYDDDEEEEETYDDVEGLTDSPPPQTGPAQASQSGKQGGGQNPGEANEEEEDIYEVLPEDDFLDPMDESNENNNKPACSSDYANYYQGIWECQTDEEDELAFQRGDLIYIISKEYNIHGWWVGELNGAVGIVPKDFLHPAYII